MEPWETLATAGKLRSMPGNPRNTLEILEKGLAIAQGSPRIFQESPEIVQGSPEIIQGSSEILQGSPEILLGCLGTVQASLEIIQGSTEIQGSPRDPGTPQAIPELFALKWDY